MKKLLAALVLLCITTLYLAFGYFLMKQEHLNAGARFMFDFFYIVPGFLSGCSLLFWGWVWSVETLKNG